MRPEMLNDKSAKRRNDAQGFRETLCDMTFAKQYFQFLGSPTGHKAK